MIRVTYLGHATVLIEMGGVRLLTDPVLRPRVGHLQRIASPPDPALLEDLGAVLISHAHHDHLDVPSLRSLPGSPPVLCPAPAAGPAASAGLEVEVLDPGATATVGELSVEATAAEHDGRRWPLPGRSPEAIGFVVRGEAGSVYFAGDTGPFEGMAAIGPVDVALLPVAGWGPKLGPGHLDPEGAADAAVAVGAAVAVPIHWGTYGRLLMRSEEAPDGPAKRFAAAVAERSPATRVETIEPGGSAELS